jgi:hypothetical protein
VAIKASVTEVTRDTGQRCALAPPLERDARSPFEEL